MTINLNKCMDHVWNYVIIINMIIIMIIIIIRIIIMIIMIIITTNLLNFHFKHQLI